MQHAMQDKDLHFVRRRNGHIACHLSDRNLCGRMAMSPEVAGKVFCSHWEKKARLSGLSFATKAAISMRAVFHLT